MIDLRIIYLFFFQVSKVVAKSSDLEEAVIQVMEEMAKKALASIQAFLTVLNRTHLKYLFEVGLWFDKGTTRAREYKIGEG